MTWTTSPPSPSPIKFDAEKAASLFVRLRDKIDEIKKRHQEELAPYMEKKEKLESIFLEQLHATNAEGIRTKSGTFYLTTRKSASLADPDAFMRFVIGGERWDLLDRKANVTAVGDFIDENNAPPPGVNFTVRQIVGVRRS